MSLKNATGCTQAQKVQAGGYCLIPVVTAIPGQHLFTLILRAFVQGFNQLSF